MAQPLRIPKFKSLRFIPGFGSSVRSVPDIVLRKRKEEKLGKREGGDLCELSNLTISVRIFNHI